MSAKQITGLSCMVFVVAFLVGCVAWAGIALLVWNVLGLHSVFHAREFNLVQALGIGLILGLIMSALTGAGRTA